MKRSRAQQLQEGRSQVPAKVTDRLADSFGLPSKFLYKTITSVVGIAKKSGDVTELEITGFMIVCDQYGLNPFTSQIYAFVDKGGKVRPLVGVDGWLNIMHRQKNFGGIKFRFEFPDDDSSKEPISCTAIIKRNDLSDPIEIEEFMEENYVPPHKGKYGPINGPWQKMPRRMLRNAALKQAVRIAFGLASIYDLEETQASDQEGMIVDFSQAKDTGRVGIDYNDGKELQDVEVEPEILDAEYREKDDTGASQEAAPVAESSQETRKETSETDQSTETSRGSQNRSNGSGELFPPPEDGDYDDGSEPVVIPEEEDSQEAAPDVQEDAQDVQDDAPDDPVEEPPALSLEELIDNIKRTEIRIRDRKSVYSLRDRLKAAHKGAKINFSSFKKISRPILLEYYQGLQEITGDRVDSDGVPF